MKKLKILFTALGVLGIVGTALAFRQSEFSVGDVWCFSSAPFANQACPGVAAHIEAVSLGGTESNLCPNPMVQFPYGEPVLGSCLPFSSGTQFISTGL
jgi:hypothetical protein